MGNPGQPIFKSKKKSTQISAVEGKSQNGIENEKPDNARMVSDSNEYVDIHKLISLGMVFQDDQGSIIQTNQTVQRIFGLPPDQMVGKTLGDLKLTIVREDGSIFPEAQFPATVALKTGKPVNDEIMGIYDPYKEKYNWIKVNSTPEYLPGQTKPHQIVSTFVDITNINNIVDTFGKHEAFLNLAMLASDLGTWKQNFQTRQFFMDDTTLRHFGLSGVQNSAQDILQRIHPEDSERILMEARTFLKKKETEPASTEFRVIHSDGTIKWLAINVIIQFIKTESGEIPYTAIGTSHDITDQKLAEEAIKRKTRAFYVLSSCDQALVKISNEIELLKEICQICVENGDYRMAWVGYVDKKSDRNIHPIAQSGFEDGYLKSIDIRWDDSEFGQGPTGMAVRTNRPEIAQNIQLDPRTAKWREAAVKRGYASTIALPINVGGDVIGILTLYAKNPNAFQPDEVSLLCDLTNDLSFAIEAIRTRTAQKNLQEELKKSEERNKLAQESAHIGIWEWNANVDTLFWSDEMYKLYDKNPDLFKPTNSSLLDCIIPEDRQQAASALDKSLSSGIPFDIEYRICDSKDQIKWMNLKGNVILGDFGQPVLAAGTMQEITQRKKMEEDLLEANRNYKLISENSNDVIWVLDVKTQKFKFISPSIEKLRGYTVDEMMQQSLRDVLTPESYATVKSIIEESIPDYLGGKPVSTFLLELDQVRKDGSIVTTEVTSTQVYDDRGNLEVVGISRDITRRKQIEHSLEQRVKELETVYQLSIQLREGDTVQDLLQVLLNETLKTIDSKDGGIFLYEPTINKLLLCAAAGWFEQLAGLSLETDEGVNGYVFTTKQPYITVEMHEDKHLAQKVKDLIPLNQSGGFFPLECSEGIIGVIDVYVPSPRIFTENEQRLLAIISQMAGNAILRSRLNEKLKLSNFSLQEEIDQRTAYQTMLAAEKELLSTTLMSIGEGVIITNKEGLIILFNRSAEFITGYETHEILDQPIYNVFQIIDPITNRVVPDLIHSLYEMTKNQEREPNYKAPMLITKSGERILVSGSISSLKSPDGDMMGHVLVFQDITEKQKAEAQTALSQKMEAIGQLAAGIAHEINTPIQYVGDNLRFLQKTVSKFSDVLDAYKKLIAKAGQQINQSDIDHLDDVYKQTRIHHYLTESSNAVQEALDGVERVRKIVLAMREFSHPSEKEKKLADINHGIETTIVISRNEWKYYADLETNLDPDLPLIYCQIDEINQVILNMIINAVQAIQDKFPPDSGQKGKITISTKKADNKIHIIIEDTGIGIPETIQQRIFDPFFTTKGLGKGTGQGLSLAHQIIVQKHQGNISVYSMMGKGTTFTIELPIDSDEKDE